MTRNLSIVAFPATPKSMLAKYKLAAITFAALTIWAQAARATCPASTACVSYYMQGTRCAYSYNPGADCSFGTACTVIATCNNYGSCVASSYPERLVTSALPSSTTAGTSNNMSVTTQVCNGSSWSTDTDYNGTVSLSSTDSQFSPASYSYVGADSGTHTFTVALKTAGSQSITASDNLGTPQSTQTATVTAASLASLSFSESLPNPLVSGFNAGYSCINNGVTEYWITNPIQIALKDAFGNATLSNDTFHVSSTDAQGRYPPNASSASSIVGFGCGPQVTLYTPGQQTLSVSDVNNPSVTSAIQAVTVTSPTSKATVSLYPSSGATSPIAGSAFGVSVAMTDANGNPSYGWSGTVTLTGDSQFSGSSVTFTPSMCCTTLPACNAVGCAAPALFSASGSHTIYANASGLSSPGLALTVATNVHPTCAAKNLQAAASAYDSYQANPGADAGLGQLGNAIVNASFNAVRLSTISRR